MFKKPKNKKSNNLLFLKENQLYNAKKIKTMKQPNCLSIKNLVHKDWLQDPCIMILTNRKLLYHYLNFEQA